MSQTAQISRVIMMVRGQRVLLDADLAALYEVETGALVRAVKRNASRFPDDFMFQLSLKEMENLRCQIGISRSWGGRRYRALAFSEQGIAMLSGVLRSPRAVAVNIEIMRAFVELRRTLESTDGLARKLEALERKYDGQFAHVFEAIRQLVAPPKTQYAVVIEEGPTSFGATVPDLPGCFAVGRTREEVERLIEEAIGEHVALLESQGQNVPEPKTRVATVTVG